VQPTADAQTYLATTLDGRARLMDASTGKLLNEFKGHANESYRCRGVLGHAEASVVLGDEDGRIWAWDLLDVRRRRLDVIDCSG
jgi:mitogen-activated protein kinase organizer 1